MKYPERIRYHIPFALWIELALAIVMVRRLSWRSHARRMIASLDPPMRVLGEENIPRNGPAVVTTNHYWSPGFWAPWMVAAITTAVPAEMYWTVTSALTFPGRRFRRLLRRITEPALGWSARVYGLNRMPPMPPDPKEAAQRAEAVRRMIHHARTNPTVVLGMAPEGGDQPGGLLSLGPEGVGKLALALAQMGLVFHPVGVYEDAGRLTLCFGKPYRLELSPDVPRESLDLRARQVLMGRIAGCLPERLRGGVAAE